MIAALFAPGMADAAPPPRPFGDIYVNQAWGAEQISAMAASGSYFGGGFGGFSAGVFTLDGVAGYNLPVMPNVIIGGEATLGIQLPSNSFELWASGKVGTPINSNILIYGTGGLGSIGGTGVYNAGVGGTIMMGNGLGLDLSGVVRAPIGFAPVEFGIRARGLWFPDMPIGSHSDWYPTPGFRLGVETSFVPSAGVAVPGGNILVTFPSGNGINVGLRGRGGIQLPSGKPEIFGGVQIGYQPPTDPYGFYLFGEGGMIGGAPVNSIGVGGSIELAPGISLTPEMFLRGQVGTLTEGGVRVGISYDISDGLNDLHRNFVP